MDTIACVLLGRRANLYFGSSLRKHMVRINLNGREWEHIGICRNFHQTWSIIDNLWRWSKWVRNHYIVWVSLYTIWCSILSINGLCACRITSMHMTIRNLIDISMRGIWDKVSRNRMMESRMHIESHLLLRHHASIFSEIYCASVPASKIKLITV